MFERTRQAALVAAIVASVLAPAVATAESRPTVDAVAEIDKPAVEPLRLRCRALRPLRRRAIVCRWSAAQSDAVAGYALRRGSPAGRKTVFRTDDPDVTRAVDHPVRRGVRYRYRILGLDHSGSVIAASRVVVAGVPKR